MAVLIIGATEREKIAKLVAYSKAHPLMLDQIRKGAASDASDRDVLKLEDRQPGQELLPSQHMVFPGGYRVAFSVEVQPIGLCSHLSISVFGRSKKSMMPSLEAIAMIAGVFGVPFPADMMWIEEFDPGEFAINLLSLYAPTQEGHA